MFGYAVANQEKLSQEERDRYRGVYCGLCRRLGELFRGRDRMTLTYDLTLLILTLSSVTDTPFSAREIRCAPHPVRPHTALTNRYTDYAANVSVLLAYYKFLDDKNDDGGLLNAAKASAFRRDAQTAEKRLPALGEKVREKLEELREAERRDERNPDVPANLFGDLLGAVFAGTQTDCGEKLFAFGKSLGKAIYLMDAVVDLKADLKKERYNPLIRTDFQTAEQILSLLLADCMEKYRALPTHADGAILENVLLSGVWTAYETQKKEGERRRAE